jgi:hypothetical protein
VLIRHNLARPLIERAARGHSIPGGNMQRIASISASAAAVAAGLTLAVPGSISLAAPTAAGGTAAPAAVTSAASLPKITVAMTGKKITVGGALQSGGVRIVSTVTGERQGEPIFVRLDPGVTLNQFLNLLKRAADPNNLIGIGSIVIDTTVGRGQTNSIQADLKPGQYVALDLAVNGQPPLTPFTIVKAASPANLPAPKATIAAIEFGFRGPRKLHDGELVRFANHGFLVHMIDFGRARNAADADKAARLLRQGKLRQVGPLITGNGSFAGPLSHRAFQQEVIRNRPGYYVLACFMQTQDGRDHVVLGMERVIRIVR